MKNLIYIFFIWVFANFQFGQSLEQMEIEYKTLIISAKNKSAGLDSLKQILNNRSKKIDSLKQTAGVKKTELENLMAETIQLSEKINSLDDELSKKLNTINKKKSHLFETINSKIDSIERNKSNDRTNTELISLYSKQIYYFPEFRVFSFNTEKLLNLDTKDPDPKKKIFIYDFLNEALVETNTKIIQTEKLIQELEDISYLEQESSEFIEEAALNNQDFMQSNHQTEEKQKSSIGHISSFPDADAINMPSSIIISLIRQIDLEKSYSNDFQISGDSVSSAQTTDQYLLLIKKLLPLLEKYKSMLQQKLND
jgi:hypothetical protein